jgi:hypothetical protein
MIYTPSELTSTPPLVQTRDTKYAWYGAQNPFTGEYIIAARWSHITVLQGSQHSTYDPHCKCHACWDNFDEDTDAEVHEVLMKALYLPTKFRHY